jgi:hypothetical protein
MRMLIPQLTETGYAWQPILLDICDFLLWVPFLEFSQLLCDRPPSNWEIYFRLGVCVPRCAMNPC